jgi:hypothetical protein
MESSYQEHGNEQNYHCRYGKIPCFKYNISMVFRHDSLLQFPLIIQVLINMGSDGLACDSAIEEYCLFDCIHDELHPSTANAFRRDTDVSLIGSLTSRKNVADRRVREQPTEGRCKNFRSVAVISLERG